MRLRLLDLLAGSPPITPPARTPRPAQTPHSRVIEPASPVTFAPLRWRRTPDARPLSQADTPPHDASVQAHALASRPRRLNPSIALCSW